MKITTFGGQSLVRKVKNELLKKVAIHDELVAYLEANDGLTFTKEYVVSNIETVDYTGRFIIKNGRTKVMSVPSWCEETITLFNLPQVR